MYSEAHRKPLAPIGGQPSSEQQHSPRNGSAPAQPAPHYTRPMDPPQESIPHYTRPTDPPQRSIPQYTRPKDPPQGSIPQYTRPSDPPPRSIPQYTRPTDPPQRSIPQYTRPTDPPQRSIPQYTGPSDPPQGSIPQYTRPTDPPQVPDMEARLAALRRDALQMMADRSGTPGLDPDGARYAGYPSQAELPTHHRMYDGADYQLQGRIRARDLEHEESYRGGEVREEEQRVRPQTARPPTTRGQESSSSGVQDRLVLDGDGPDNQEQTKADPPTEYKPKASVTFSTPPHSPKPPSHATKRSHVRKPRARSASPPSRRSIMKSETSPVRSSGGGFRTSGGGSSVGRTQWRHREPHPRGTMVHLSTLVTKPPGPPPKAPEKMTFDTLEDHGMRYMHVGCHDWACNCLVPQTVRRQARDGRGSRGQAPSVHSRRHYMVPGGSTLVDRGHQEIMRHSTKGQMMVVDSSQGTKQLSSDSTTAQSRSSLTSKLLKGPISAPGAFLVSAPHWQGRSHTQRWPWAGKVQAHVWPHPEGGLRLVDASLAPRASGVSIAT